MANSDRENTWIEHDKALRRIITEMVMDQIKLYKQFNDNGSFHKVARGHHLFSNVSLRGI